jgi:hypothetical protein
MARGTRQKSLRGFLEPLVRVDDVVERHVSVVRDPLRTSPLIHHVILPCSRTSPPAEVRRRTNEAAVTATERGRGQATRYS